MAELNLYRFFLSNTAEFVLLEQAVYFEQYAKLFATRLLQNE